jgi:hypothetical protein
MTLPGRRLDLGPGLGFRAIGLDGGFRLVLGCLGLTARLATALCLLSDVLAESAPPL